MSASKNKFQEEEAYSPHFNCQNWAETKSHQFDPSKNSITVSEIKFSSFHHTFIFCEYLHYLLFAGNQISYTLLMLLRIVVCRKFLLSKIIS